ncbi:MAG: PLD nuclease N-terminal domain-containing protein [Actinomycetales bacterium]|nr:PLD nuclease N-terminal domain-containing protein [Leifsonia sp.]
MKLDLNSLPIGVVVALAALLLVELALDIFALVDLIRRPRSRVTFGNKWVWAAIIVLINLIGAILYLAIGRKPAPPTELAPPAAKSRTSMSSVADALYGETDDRDTR